MNLENSVELTLRHQFFAETTNRAKSLGSLLPHRFKRVWANLRYGAPIIIKQSNCTE